MLTKDGQPAEGSRCGFPGRPPGQATARRSHPGNNVPIVYQVEMPGDMIYITPSIAIREDEIQEHFIRAPGPGGQNVNKVATAVQLRFDVAGSSALPDDVRARLARLAGRRMTQDGTLIIQARRFRTQERNRQDAMEQLIRLIRQAARSPKPRHKTRPTPASRQRRLEAKRRRSETKRQRRPISRFDE